MNSATSTVERIGPLRLDLFLKKTHLVHQRAQAKSLCDAGRVHVNDRAAKPALILAPGDRIRLQLPGRLVEAEVLDVPERGNVARRDAGRFIRIWRDERIDRIGELLGGDGGTGPDAEPPEDADTD
jgi:ribosomal 50S subunit-recycling heat shock protein